MLSVIIPSWKDPLLHKTIDSLLENAVGEIEVIAVLDGYWSETPFTTDPRLKVLHIGKNGGMRNAINSGVKIAKGEYLMRTDEHCIFAPGFDKVLTEDCPKEGIMTPRRYFLDAKKWEVMDLPYVDYEYLAIQSIGEGKKFTGIPWDTRKEDRKDILIDETMAMQGSCWFMRKDWWEKVIIELDSEGYGPLLQDSHEMVFKTWKAGGKLWVNKKTWFAHKHRSFTRTHQHGGKQAEDEVKFCYETWKDYYKEIKKLWGPKNYLS